MFEQNAKNIKGSAREIQLYVQRMEYQKEEFKYSMSDNADYVLSRAKYLDIYLELSM